MIKITKELMEFLDENEMILTVLEHGVVVIETQKADGNALRHIGIVLSAILEMNKELIPVNTGIGANGAILTFIPKKMLFENL